MIKILERQTFLIALTFVTGLFLFLLKPFFAPILWACIIAILFHPVQLWLKKKLGEQPNLIALITLIACIFLVVIPFLLLLTSFFQQGSALYQRIASGEIQLAQYFDQIRRAFPVMQQFLERMDIDIASLQKNATELVVGIGSFLTQNAVALGIGTFNFFTKLALMLYIAFFLLRDGRQLIEKLIYVIPMGDERERLLFQNIAGVARATVKGNLLVAMLQGTLGGLIFWILGIPSPLLWGVIMAIFSMIPVIGAGLVWVPAAIYLYTITQWFEATVLIAYGVFIIGLADNVLRPILVGRDTKLPDWMVLLSTLGGLTLIGVNGFVVGPLIAVLFVAFWQIFGKDFNVGKYAHQDSNSEIETNAEDSIKSKPGKQL
ncbi:AI-2E family transporter [Nitrosomonas communis]|uniref:Predicted PurR-regulated permease PerM n=1 Tax=Nitrosomonas communis TaxID=44574 RepID=A0A1H2WR92_9PROT|nr:AI-2E family transporter [Nitrosomonas communis]SDW83142.1 Predicted PurR-regulated permease PerM [Nitrosomonas communis]